uniref:Uncharacterized protein n=1 Tax=Plectus sambesii TaxID=2011161 RepID=A0A914XD29_9BILA
MLTSRHRRPLVSALVGHPARLTLSKETRPIACRRFAGGIDRSITARRRASPHTHRLTDRSDSGKRLMWGHRSRSDDGYANLLMVGPIGPHNAPRLKRARRRRSGRIKRTARGGLRRRRRRVFMHALINLLDRLKGPYNLENVINPMNVQISEAIMIFQERGQNISTKVMENCFDFAPNPSSRVKRGAMRRHKSHELSLDELQYGSNRVASAANSPASSLERMALELREKVANVKGFWRSLSYSLCNDQSVATPADEENNCWNGTKKAKYSVPLVGDGLANQGSNPEVAVSESAGMVTDQILRLRMDTSRLVRAYEGRSIDWESTASDQNRPRPAVVVTPRTVDDEDDDDDDDDEPEMSGSGDGGEKSIAKINDFPPHQSPKGMGVPKAVADNSDDEELVVEEGSGSGDFVEPPAPPVVSTKGSDRANGMRERPIDLSEPSTTPRTVPPPKFQLPDVGTDFNDVTEDFEIAVASERPPTKSCANFGPSLVLLFLITLTATARIRIR